MRNIWVHIWSVQYSMLIEINRLICVVCDSLLNTPLHPLAVKQFLIISKSLSCLNSSSGWLLNKKRNTLNKVCHVTHICGTRKHKVFTRPGFLIQAFQNNIKIAVTHYGELVAWIKHDSQRKANDWKHIEKSTDCEHGCCDDCVIVYKI